MRFLLLGAHRKAVLKSRRLVSIRLNGFCALDPICNIEWEDEVRRIVGRIGGTYREIDGGEREVWGTS